MRRIRLLGIALVLGCGARSGLPDDGSGAASASGGSHASGGMSHGDDGGGGDASDGGSGPMGGYPPGCDVELPGSTMVELETPSGFRYCIDSFEVTNADYASFLENTTIEPDPLCYLPKPSHVPTEAWPPAADKMDFPVTWVDQCDARAYCSWAGKRLCRGFDGQISALPDPNTDEWAFACTAGGTQPYPYGTEEDPTACVEHADAASPVGSLATCEGGFPGIYDMLGNVFEWADFCTDPLSCHFRGTSWLLTDDGKGCTDVALGSTVTTQGSVLGIRCCRDAE